MKYNSNFLNFGHSVKTSVWVQIKIKTTKKPGYPSGIKVPGSAELLLTGRRNEEGKCSFVDPDANADLFGINFNQNVTKTTLFSNKFQYTVQNTTAYGNYDTDEKEKKMNFNPALL